VRIHGDASPDSRISGLSTLYPASNKWTSRIAGRSKRAASRIQQFAIVSTGAVDRGVHRRRDLVGFNWSKVPTVLVECGFLSNPVEDRLLASPHYQDKVAAGIADGIMAYLSKENPK
jgi:N-acetylmuramoyl-L-alanine amidase